MSLKIISISVSPAWAESMPYRAPVALITGPVQETSSDETNELGLPEEKEAKNCRSDRNPTRAAFLDHLVLSRNCAGITVELSLFTSANAS